MVGNKFGVRETNSEFGKSIRSSGNKFGFRRKISVIFPYCAMLAELRIVCPGKQIWSSGNHFGVREINSEFGKQIRSSAKKIFFDFFPSYRSNLKKLKTCWVLEMSLFLKFDGKFY